MSGGVIFLSIEHILAVHDRMIMEFGGDSGVRDRALLESAAAMPMAQYDGKYLHRNLAEMAAAYLFHLCRNHPFVDGNKRTALASAEVFLLLNEFKFAATNPQLERLTMQVAEGKIDKEQVIKFFLEHVKI